MTPRLTHLRIVTALALVALVSTGDVRAAEPISAPPAELQDAPAPPSAAPLLPLIPPDAGALAPVVMPDQSSLPSLAPMDTSAPSRGTVLDGPQFGGPVDATEKSGVLPASRRDPMLNGDLYGTPRRVDQRALAPQMIGGAPSMTYSYNGAAPAAPGTSAEAQPTPAASDLGADFNPNEAMVRISDRPAELTTGDVPGPKPSHWICPHCRYCPHGLPYHECPECEPSAAMMRRYRRRHGVTLPPDYGWSPPGYYPIDRVSIDYYRAFPACWSGQPASAHTPIARPSVYWPTDTTQLGYTYQQAPRWMPYPGMVPPVPHPAQWHIPLCSAHGGCGPHGACPNCQPHGAEVLVTGPVSEATLPGSGSVSPAMPQQQTAQLPSGPELKTPIAAPSLSPVPF